jgi:glycosidase
MCPSNGPGSSDYPDWVREAIFYQIFPDRFAQNHMLRKPGNLLDWREAPGYSGYYGGDLLGV